MMNDSAAILDDFLSRWFHYTQQYKLTAGIGSQPMFRYTQRPRGGQTVEALIDDDLEAAQMEAIDFQVSEMKDPHRAAIYVLARNLSTGRSVWLSPRLPTDPLERATIVAEARNQIVKRLMAVGVM